MPFRWWTRARIKFKKNEFACSLLFRSRKFMRWLLYRLNAQKSRASWSICIRLSLAQPSFLQLHQVKRKKKKMESTGKFCDIKLNFGVQHGVLLDYLSCFQHTHISTLVFYPSRFIIRFASEHKLKSIDLSISFL